MHITSKLVCPHCHALLKSTQVITPGQSVQCLTCRAPFTVAAADLANGGTEPLEDHVSAILVPSSGALDLEVSEGIAVLSPGPNGEDQDRDRRPEPHNGITARPSRSAPLMSTPYLPPPTPKEALQSTLFLPPTRTRSILPLLAVIVGLVFLIAGGVSLTWYCLGENSDDRDQADLQQPLLPFPPDSGEDLLKKEPQEILPEAKKDNPDPGLESDASKNPAPKAPEKSAQEPFPVPAPPKTRPVPRPRPPVTQPPLVAWREAEQKKVNQAVERGVQYLKSKHEDNGTWSGWGAHTVGYSALVGLTLLECQVPADDPVVKKAAAFVRTNGNNQNQTYDLSLAILFLDRLGDRKDSALIQQLALRLVAGQSYVGGWDYPCPNLTIPESRELLTFLRKTRPEAAKLLNPLAKGNKRNDPLVRNKDGKLADPLGKDKERLADPLIKDTAGSLANPLPGTGPAKLGNGKRQTSAGPAEVKLIPPGDKPDPQANFPGLKKKPPAASSKPSPFRVEQLAPRIRTIPVVLDYYYKGQIPEFFRAGRDDNSNSQFAMLGLWAARRHDVPSERVLGLSFRRYQVSQHEDGGWNYQFRGKETEAAMTGVGLLGLAMGHATSEEGLRVAFEARNKNGAQPRPLLRDPAIQKGLKAFGQFIGKPDPENFTPKMVNLYFLWTVERVAMLYNLNTIADKDWYRWGVHVLLPNQHPGGSWHGGQYPGSDLAVDTCFALLFLKRSNLVQDLTDNLNFYLAITESDAGRGKNR